MDEILRIKSFEVKRSESLLEWCRETYAVGQTMDEASQVRWWSVYRADVSRHPFRRGTARDNMTHRHLIGRIPRPSSAEALADRIERAAGDAHVRKVTIHARQPSTKNQYSTLTWTFEDDGFDEDDFDEDEVVEDEPSMEGAQLAQVGQLLRHNERLFDIVTQTSSEQVKGATALVKSLQDELVRLRKELADLYQERFVEKRQALEILHTQDEQELERNLKKQNHESVHQVIRSGLTVVQHWLTGGSKGASDGSPLVQSLQHLVHSMDTEQLQALGSILRTDQQALLVQLFNSIDNRRETPESSSNAVVPPSSDPPNGNGHHPVSPELLQQLRDTITPEEYQILLNQRMHRRGSGGEGEGSR